MAKIFQAYLLPIPKLCLEVSDAEMCETEKENPRQRLATMAGDMSCSACEAQLKLTAELQIESLGHFPEPVMRYENVLRASAQ